VNFSFEQQGYVGILRFYGELSSERESELTEALMLSLDNSDYLVVNLQNVTVSDCASLRPILSAHQIATRQNKSLKLIGVNEEILKCAVNHDGYSRSESVA
jgi:anti-anti-sigma factor